MILPDNTFFLELIRYEIKQEEQRICTAMYLPPTMAFKLVISGYDSCHKMADLQWIAFTKRLWLHIGDDQA